MIQLWLMPQPDWFHGLHLLARWSTPHWGKEAHTFLNQHLPKRWIGRSEDADDVYSGPPKSLDLKPCDFVWCYVKDTHIHRVYILSTPKTIEELKLRICNADAPVNEHMLQNVCREMEYCLDVVRVNKGSHISDAHKGSFLGVRPPKALDFFRLIIVQSV
ncbi:uncharacterized protein TNCV_3585591 [Trichonephila clavipes]|nr:uncharacterized protein TNCV_3585591 [Trichonephila clavipes]